MGIAEIPGLTFPKKSHFRLRQILTNGIFCIGEIRRKQPSVFHDPQQKLHDELVTEEHLALTAMALFLI
ncbi:hypothetical protein EK904_014053 [Melospiza melodia maxima]|nr:hypothetical protein EK904_014053 [Melospiza melodia maxima]